MLDKTRFRTSYNNFNFNDTPAPSQVRLIREYRAQDGSTATIDAWMPSGKGWNQGNPGALDWINLNVGWRPYDEYWAEKNSKLAEEKRQTELVKRQFEESAKPVKESKK